VVSEKKINKGQREAYTTAACHSVKVEQVYMYIKGTGYEYDGNVFVAWVLPVRRAEVVTK
jgi:hypothetical protein